MLTELPRPSDANKSETTCFWNSSVFARTLTATDWAVEAELKAVEAEATAPLTPSMTDQAYLETPALSTR